MRGGFDRIFLQEYALQWVPLEHVVEVEVALHDGKERPMRDRVLVQEEGSAARGEAKVLPHRGQVQVRNLGDVVGVSAGLCLLLVRQLDHGLRVLP